MKSRRLIALAHVIIGMLLIVVSGTIGCTKQQAEEPVRITLMHGWGGTLQTHKTMQEIYAGFSKENPDILLQCIPYSDSNIAVKKANDMLAVGKMPDILSTNGLSYFMKNAVKCNKAMNLMTYIEKDNQWKNQIHPAVFSTWQTEDGSLYTLPDALEVSGYWYHEEYLRQAGVVTENGEVRIPKTWEEFMEMTEQLEKWIEQTGRDISVFTLEKVQMTESLFLARLAGEGTNGMTAAQNPNIIIGVDILENTLADLNILKKYSKDVDSIENARQSFSDGKSIIYFNGVWESDVLKLSPLQADMAYACYPTADGKSLSYVSASSGYVVARQENERKTDACIRFLKYMLSEEVQMKIALETGQAPLNPNIDRQFMIQQSPLLGKSLESAYQADIQISTIPSVWTEEKIEIVNQYLGQATWDLEHSRKMILELNR